MSSTSRLLIASPRPVPPNSRVVELSTWLNDRNSRSCFSGGMPRPVSATVKCRPSSPALAAAFRSTATTTSPLAVNLIALPTRLTTTCRRRVTSPTTTTGTAGSSSATSSRPFSAAFGASSSSASSRHWRRLYGWVSSSILPDSILEKSRTSLMIVSRLSPELRMISTKSRCSALSGVSTSSVVMPITPFIGVRISWLMLARNSDFARVASSSFWLSEMSAVLLSTSCCWLSRRAPVRLVALHLVEVGPRVVADARDQLDLVGQLDQVVVRARGKRLPLCHRILLRREDDDGDVLRDRVGPVLAHEREPVHARHHEVLQDDGGLDVGRHREGLGGVRAIVEIDVRLVGQHAADGLAHHRLVIHQQHHHGIFVAQRDRHVRLLVSV